MSFTNRALLYDEIENYRKRPLISYVNSLRVNASAQMASDVIPEFTQQILRLEKKQGIDLLIVSNGGDPMVAWRIISLLREQFNEIGVFLPFTAYSAATLLAMGADEIYMHKFANLGPVDPQITSNRNVDGRASTTQFSTEDLVHYVKFIREDFGLTDQSQLTEAFKFLGNDVGPLAIGYAKRTSHLALSLGEKLLLRHSEDENEAKRISGHFNKGYFAHGYPVSRSEAKKIGLPIMEEDPKLEDLIWKIWEDFEEEMQCNNPFNPLTIVMEDESCRQALNQINQIINVPANLPPDVLNQLYNRVLQQISIIHTSPVKYFVKNSILESLRYRSEFTTSGIISAIRLPDLNVSMNVQPLLQRWSRQSTDGD